MEEVLYLHGSTLPSQAMMEGSMLVEKVKVHRGKRHVVFNILIFMLCLAPLRLYTHLTSFN